MLVKPNRDARRCRVTPSPTSLSPKILVFAVSTVLVLASFSVAKGQSASDLLQTGLQALDAKDFSRAMEKFSELVKTDPSPTNISYLAVAESGAGKLDQAIEDFQRAIKLGNDTTLTRYGLGSAYLRIHKPEAAARELRLVLAKDPNNLPARYALGVALLDEGRAHEAIPYLEEARKHSPNNAQVWVSLIRAQFQAANPEAAMQLADDAAVAVPDQPPLLIALARLCLQYQQLPKARTLLESAVELQPNDADARLLLANVCLHTGNPAESLEILKDLPAGTGKPGETMILMAEARALTGDPNLARTDLSLALEADPANPDYLLVSAWLDQMQSRFEPALATLNKARGLEGDKPDLLYQLAISYYLLGDFAHAADACAGVIRLAPRYDRAYLLEGVSELERNEMVAARAAIEQAVALSPDSALDHRELGVTLFKMGNLDASQAEFDRALTLDPNAVQAYYGRAQVLNQKGEPQKAIDDLETAIALEPKYTEAYAALAKLYSAHGQEQKAAAMLETEKKLEQSERPSDRKRGLLWQELSAPLP
jgi:tetratricopeptide (TPR) repeat protein